MNQIDFELNVAHNAYGEIGGRLRLPRPVTEDNTPAVVGGQVLYLQYDGLRSVQTVALRGGND
jgi:hypothetical protein